MCMCRIYVCTSPITEACNEYGIECVLRVYDYFIIKKEWIKKDDTIVTKWNFRNEKGMSESPQKKTKQIINRKNGRII